MKKIYLDHASTTYVDPRVLKKMLPFFSQCYGNPSSLYLLGREAKTALHEARQKVASCFKCSLEEIIFTGSGTESDNLAIVGSAWAHKNKGNHLITSNIEHHAVAYSCEYLKQHGFTITYLPVDHEGLINPQQVAEAITDTTILVSIHYANNEIGTVEPISEIASVCQKKGILLHTDACQAAGVFDMDVQKLGIDLLTINGSKIYGPKGTGALYIRKGIDVDPIIHGGSQEFNKRAGTENTAGIVGLAEAFYLAQQEREEENQRLTTMRDFLIKKLLATIPKSRLNGHATKRLPNNVNISFLNVEGEAILLHLDELGIYVSTGSACTSESLEPSHVLLALGLPHEVAHGSIRITLGKKNTFQDIKRVVNVLPQVIEKLRSISPLHLTCEDFPALFS